MKFKEQSDSDSLSLEEFRELIDRRLVQWGKSHYSDSGVEKWCLETYESVGSDYCGADAWKLMFFHHFGINENSF